MKRMKQKRTYYFSEKLKRQIQQVPYYPVTVLEAPSGFGKTTVIKEYLKEIHLGKASEYWYTCLGESSGNTWNGICDLLSKINEQNAAYLKRLGPPTLESLPYIIEIFQHFHCRQECYFIIDNYQLFDCEILCELISVSSLHGCSGFHIIFITQQIGAKQQLIMQRAEIHIIDAAALFLDKKETANLFAMDGIRLSEHDLEQVYECTGGWISAIRLHVVQYKENASFECVPDIEKLVESAIWNKLRKSEKEFLLAVSVMDSFTSRQGAILIEKEYLPVSVELLLKNNDFIYFHHDSGKYHIHSILQNYLRRRFYFYLPTDAQNHIFRLAGKALADNEQYFEASQFFFNAHEYEAILSLPLEGRYLGNQKEKKLIEFIEAIIQQCPEEILCRYPFVMLVFAYPILFGGYNDTFQKLYQYIQKSIVSNYLFDADELRRVKGEFALLTSFLSYNNIEKMNEGHNQAWSILGEPSKIISRDMPYTLGSVSVLSMFWRDPGNITRVLQVLQNDSSYYRLARGHGVGASSVIQSELLIMHGDDVEAEIMCHKALYEARCTQQIGICLCAELILGKIAILRGDGEGYRIAIKRIQDYIEENADLYILRMVDCCLSELCLSLGRTDLVTKWVRDVDKIQKILYAPAIPFALTLHSKILLLEQRHYELYGLSPIVMNLSENFHYLMPQLFHHIFLAAVKSQAGNEKEAQEYINEALAIALPDQIYLPFAQGGDLILPLLENAKLHGFDRMRISALIACCHRYQQGIRLIQKTLDHSKSILTPREKEVALYARERHSAREIALKLYISESTVRTILKSVYQKLDIHSKSELVSKDF